MHGVSNQDTHLCPPHNSSVHLQQQHMCGALGGPLMEGGVVGQLYEAPYFHPRHRLPPSRNDPPKKSLSPAQPTPHRCRTFLLLFVKMWYGLLCSLWVWCRRTNRRPCCPPLSNPSTSPWTAWPDGSGRWDNRVAAQHLPRDLLRPSSGVKIWLKRRRRSADWNLSPATQTSKNFYFLSSVTSQSS